MANSLGNGILNAEFWMKVMQEQRFKTLVAKKLTNMEMRSMLKSGDTVHFPFRTEIVAQTYTKGSAFTVQDLEATDETLTVSTAKVAPFFLDDIDKVQNSFQTAREFGRDAMDRLNRIIDSTVLAEYDQATSTVTNQDVGGSGTTAISLTASNVNKIFTAANRKLNNLNVTMQNRFAVISPSVLEIIQGFLANKDTAFGDKVGADGDIGNRFGMNIFVSNNLTSTGKWTPANNPSEGDTLTIQGVVITFTASATVAGECLIGGSTALTLDNLVAMLNGTGTGDGTDYFEFSTANRNILILNGVTATDGTTNMTLEAIGSGELVLSASDEDNDPWSLEVLHCLFGQKGATHLVVQKEPKMVIKDVPDKLGKNFAPWTLFGIKTFNNNTDKLVDVRIDSSLFS